jgi:hypothetical protein
LKAYRKQLKDLPYKKITPPKRVFSPLKEYSPPLKEYYLALSFSFFLTRLSSIVEDGALDSNCSILVVSSQFKFANVSIFSTKHLKSF